MMKTVIAVLCLSLSLAANAQEPPAPMSKQEFIDSFVNDSGSAPTDKEEAQFVNLQDTIFFACLGKPVPTPTQRKADTKTMLNTCSNKLPEHIDFTAKDIEQKMSGFDQCFTSETLTLLGVSEEKFNQCATQTDMNIPMDEKIGRASNDKEKAALETLKVFISQ